MRWLGLVVAVIISVIVSVFITISIKGYFPDQKPILIFIYLLLIPTFTVLIIFIFNKLTSENIPSTYIYHDSQQNDNSSSLQSANYPKPLDCIYTSEYRTRLQNHIDKIRINSAVNLVTGLIISACGLWVIFTYHEDSKEIKDNIIIYYLLSKFFAVLFVELLAYFFLNLYKQNLHDIKYFQNELANIDSKLIALNFSLRSENHKVFSYVLRQLARTDRNHIIKSGESTVELEKNDYQSLIDLLTQVLKSNSGASSKDAS